jgi:hypothetical protein
MKTVRFIAVLSAVLAIDMVARPSAAAEEEGVALAIVYDTSGSMRETVLDQSGKRSPKYEIANRALIAIARQIETFATNKATPRKVDAGLYIFEGQGAKPVVDFGPFKAASFESWARNFNQPTGSTPLGNALNTAGHAVLNSPLSRKHVLVITDGNNTAGPPPASVMPRLKERVSVHFVAFDVDAKVFEAVKKQGATVVGAANEAQLNNQLQYILQRKILLEDEEPPKKKD